MLAFTQLNMRNRGVRVTAAAGLLSLLAGPLLAADLDGNWARGDGNAKVEIAPCGAQICATNTWIKPGSGSEKAGDKLVMTIDRTADGSYSGTAFDPQRNMTFKITVVVAEKKMTTKGCVAGGILCRAVNWSRID
jgi:uncharacterized protein (DUF2147 family)